MRPKMLKFSRGLRKTGGCFIILIVLVTAFIVVSALFISHLRDLITDLAISDATDTVTITVNDVVSQELSDGKFDYDRLVTLEKDDDGHITALRTNMANVSVLQAEVTNLVVTSLAKSDITGVRVPLGNILGLSILSGRGPRIELKTLSVTNVSTDFKNEFSSVGINQTRHEIVLEVHVDLNIFFAGRASKDEIVTEVRIAETVIVGNVPNTFADFE